MKVISFETIKNMNIKSDICYSWVEDALLKKDRAILPPKLSMKSENGGSFITTMPVVLPEGDCAGVKIVTRYPDRAPSLFADILLYDYATGKTIALMDGTWITTMRTGAVAVHSIKQFARDDFKTIGMIGLGNVARATLDILLDIYPDRDFVIKLKEYKNQHREFMERYKEHKNIRFETYGKYEEVIAESDVVISAVTYFDEDICTDESCYKKGVTLIPIHTKGFTSCDLFFDKVFVDDIGHVSGFKNFTGFKSLAEVSEVISGKAKGRDNDSQRILVYNVGIALHDIYFADRIYRLLKDVKTDELNYDNKIEKYWV